VNSNTPHNADADPKRLYLKVHRLVECIGPPPAVLTALAMILVAVVFMCGCFGSSLKTFLANFSP